MVVTELYAAVVSPEIARCVVVTDVALILREVDRDRIGSVRDESPSVRVDRPNEREVPALLRTGDVVFRVDTDRPAEQTDECLVRFGESIRVRLVDCFFYDILFSILRSVLRLGRSPGLVISYFGGAVPRVCFFSVGGRGICFIRCFRYCFSCSFFGYRLSLYFSFVLYVGCLLDDCSVLVDLYLDTVFRCADRAFRFCGCCRNVLRAGIDVHDGCSHSREDHERCHHSGEGPVPELSVHRLNVPFLIKFFPGDQFIVLCLCISFEHAGLLLLIILTGRGSMELFPETSLFIVEWPGRKYPAHRKGDFSIRSALRK